MATKHAQRGTNGRFAPKSGQAPTDQQAPTPRRLETPAIDQVQNLALVLQNPEGKRISDELTKARTETKSLEIALATAKDQLSDARAALVELGANHDDLKAEQGELTSKLLHAEKAVTGLRGENSALRVDVAAMQSKHDSLVIALSAQLPPGTVGPDGSGLVEQIERHFEGLTIERQDALRDMDKARTDARHAATVARMLQAAHDNLLARFNTLQETRSQEAQEAQKAARRAEAEEKLLLFEGNLKAIVTGIILSVVAFVVGRWAR